MMFGLRIYQWKLINCFALALVLSSCAVNAQTTDASILKKELQRVYETKSVDSLNAFISTYYSIPGNDAQVKKEAERIRDEFAWQEAQNDNTYKAYRRFLSLYPNSVQAVFAKQRVDYYEQMERKKENVAAYQEAKRQDNIQAYEDFIASYPSSQWIKYAHERIAQLKRIDYDSTLSEALNTYSYSALLKVYDFAQHDSSVHFDDILDKFVFGYVKQGDTLRFIRLFDSFPQLKNNLNFVKMYNDTKTLDLLISSPILDKKKRKAYSKYFSCYINDKSFALLKKYSIQYSVGLCVDDEGKALESPISVVDSATGAIVGTFYSSATNGLFFYNRTLKPSYIMGAKEGYLSIPQRVKRTKDTICLQQENITRIAEKKQLFILPLSSIILKGQRLSSLSKAYFLLLSQNIKDVPYMTTLQSVQATQIKEYMSSVGANSAKIVASNQVEENETRILQIGFITQ